MNEVVLIGRLARDPELRFVPATGMAVANMVLAVDKDMSRDKKQELAGQGKPTADFINIVAFGKQAENCANYLAKGRECAVHGRVTTNNYTTQSGEKKYSTNITADRVEFIGSKGQAAAQQQSSYDEDEEDPIFTPVDDDEIPF